MRNLTKWTFVEILDEYLEHKAKDPRSYEWETDYWEKLAILTEELNAMVKLNDHRTLAR